MKWSQLLGGILCIYVTSKPTFAVTYFLQQGHTSSSKATLPNSATPYDIMGVNYIHTVTAIYPLAQTTLLSNVHGDESLV